MKSTSLFQIGKYSNDWIKDFYDQAGIWWGTNPQAEGVHAARAKIVERLCGAGLKRILAYRSGWAGAGHTHRQNHDIWGVDAGVVLSRAVGTGVRNTN